MYQKDRRTAQGRPGTLRNEASCTDDAREPNLVGKAPRRWSRVKLRDVIKYKNNDFYIIQNNKCIT